MASPIPSSTPASSDDYFDSYGDAGVHRLMIQDEARTLAYRSAIEALVQPGMTVLDVGAGSGILSLFAARAGARRVHAVEASPIGPVIERLAEANDLHNVVEVHRCRVEDLKLDGQVDLIVSEWMGYFGLAERMYESVLGARDRLLKPGGIMMPGRFRLTLFPVDDEGLHHVHGTGMWEDPVHGFDFRILQDYELSDPMTTSPVIPRTAAIGPYVDILDLDLHEATQEQFDFDASVELPIECRGTVHGLAGYFEVDLGGHVLLSCSPEAPTTHWRQSWFPLRPFDVEVGDVLRVRMRALRRDYGDRRLPDYLTEGELVRDGEVRRSFTYRHVGSFD